MAFRSRKRFRITSFSDGVRAARGFYQQGSYLDSFDLFEQLVDTYPDRAIPLLAEVHDLYERLPGKESRYHLYQSRYFEFDIKPAQKVLDIGSGHLPFPFATHLADLALQDGTVGRAGEPFKHIEGKPVYECNVENMPFADKEFDFVYCSHVLEHANDPEKACRELMRVGKRGYIETPTREKDLWLNSAKISNHRWAVGRKGNTLTFSEYSPEELRGLGCDILMSMHCRPTSRREKAFSALIYLKASFMNTMFYWENEFGCEVRRLGEGEREDPEATLYAGHIPDSLHLPHSASSPPALLPRAGILASLRHSGIQSVRRVLALLHDRIRIR